MTILRAAVLIPLFGSLLGTASAAIRRVGPREQYRRPCQAIAEARDGDQILIDASGAYNGDVCAITANGLTLQGINGRPRIDAAGKSVEGKGIWVVRGNSTVVENIEFSGARVADRNGAGIRQEGRDVTIRNCYFHDNQAGILTGASGNIVIEYSEFARNGNGDGQSHNIYINHAASFTMRFCYSHHSIGGQLVKSRAAANYILYNRLTDEGGSNYEIDLPNGGLAYIIGNVIQKSATATNRAALVCYLTEGSTPQNPERRLYIVNNTFVNASTPSCRFVWVASPAAAVIRNNIFSGPGIVTNRADAVMSGNFRGDARFRNAAAYDYHLLSGSPAIGVASAPGNGGAFPLMPGFGYVHPACSQKINPRARLNAGAFQPAAIAAPVPGQPARCAR